MSMDIDHSKPLTDEQKRWLHEWSLDHEIEVNERIHGQKKTFAKGQPVDVKAALAKAGVEVPKPPPPPTVAGQEFYVGPIVVEGENDVPPAPGEPSTVVPLPRDHPLTGIVDTNQGLTDPVVRAAYQQESDLVETKDDGEFDVKATRKEVEGLTVEELKDNLRDLGKSVSGNKDELQDRLVDALRKAHEEQQAE